MDVLALAVMRAIDQLSLQTLLKQLRDAEGNDVEPDGIAGASPAIQRTIEMISRVADGDATVLITGETGTGMGLVARALHNRASCLAAARSQMQVARARDCSSRRRVARSSSTTSGRCHSRCR